MSRQNPCFKGMEMVYRSLVEALKKEGVEPIETVGQEFDPHLAPSGNAG